MTRRTFAAMGSMVAFLFLGRAFLSGPTGNAQSAESKRVYGEWRIRVRPDKGAEYAKLIQEKGLPLFREAGGKMVGWWTTLIGDLYEHVTIWEYEGMPAFEKAVGFLGKDERFRKFVELRDPLLTGEESRFLRLSSPGERPALPENARFLIHETHRVPLHRVADYFKASEAAGALFKKNGFRYVGPFQTIVGKWSEFTCLFFYDSLAERDVKLAAMASNGDGQKIDRLLGEAVDEVSTRLCVPAPFAQ